MSITTVLLVFSGAALVVLAAIVVEIVRMVVQAKRDEAEWRRLYGRHDDIGLGEER